MHRRTNEQEQSGERRRLSANTECGANASLRNSIGEDRAVEKRREELGMSRAELGSEADHAEEEQKTDNPEEATERRTEIRRAEYTPGRGRRPGIEDGKDVK